MAKWQVGDIVVMGEDGQIETVTTADQNSQPIGIATGPNEITVQGSLLAAAKACIALTDGQIVQAVFSRGLIDDVLNGLPAAGLLAELEKRVGIDLIGPLKDELEERGVK